MHRSRLLILLLTVLLAGCSPRALELPALAQRPSPTPTVASSATAAPSATAEPSATTQPSATTVPSATAAPSATLPPTETATATPSPLPTETATPSPTPDPYAALTIAALRAETYGDEGEIEVVEELAGGPGFRRYRIAFPSDGLRVEGFMNVPDGDGPFPVVIVNHGYMPTESYDLLTYTTGYADAFAQAGFLAIHPSYRNHRGSERGENAWRVGYARDVMHLTVMARRLPQTDGAPVGMWGHSMGGGITLRVLAVMPEQIGAAVLYGSMSADEAQNYEAIMRWTGGVSRPGTGLPVSPAADPALYAAISPINFLDGVSAPIQIHHGAADATVPYLWSQQLTQRLDGGGVPYELFAYAGGPHNLAGEQRAQLTERVIEFFRATLER